MNDDDLAPTPDAPWGWAISRKGTRYKKPRPRTEAEKQAAIKAASMVASIHAKVVKQLLFKDRGLSDRTIKVLIEYNDMDLPERLLFMQEDEIRKIPGIGKVAANEILSYRKRFKSTE